MLGWRRDLEHGVRIHAVPVDVVWCLDLRADAAPDLCAQQPKLDAASDLRSQPAPDTHALVSQKDAAADPSAIAAPYT